MKIPRKRIDQVEIAYSNLRGKSTRITKSSTTWKVIDMKTNSCVAKFSNFYDIENEIRNKTKK